MENTKKKVFSYELKITLLDYGSGGDFDDMYKDFKNPDGEKVSFTVIVPSNYTFEGLHRIIMECTNWEGYHLYAFEFSHYLNHIVEIPIEGGYPLRPKRRFKKSHDPRTTTLNSLFEFDKVCNYVYDHGDDWRCRIRVVRVLDKNEAPPEAIKFSGKWPPEDCGGLTKFERMLKAIIKKSNKEPLCEEEQDKLDWLADMKFNDFDMTKINTKLAKLPKSLRK